MTERPKICYILTFLWPLLSIIFILWCLYSIDFVLVIPSWPLSHPAHPLYPILYFGVILSTIVWLVFACVFLAFSYGTFMGKKWVWTAGVIISSIFIVVFGLMLGSFMVTAVMFPSYFSVAGLNTVIIAFLIDLIIIYFITRPDIKAYFKVNSNH